MMDTRLKQTSVIHPNPKIIIVGAGVGGAMLANLCEIAGFNYLVLEKAPEFKLVGSAMSLNHYTLDVLDQLGIYEELLKVAKPFGNLMLRTVDVKTGKMKFHGKFNPETEPEKKFGYPTLMFARPDLMKALLKRVPKSKILMQKKVLTVQQNAKGVMVRVADGSTYNGDILVGADGCYSPVRQSMFTDIKKRKELSKNDSAPLKYNIDCLVGVTESLDTKEFPEMTKAWSDFQAVLPKQLKGSI